MRHIESTGMDAIIKIGHMCGATYLVQIQDDVDHQNVCASLNTINSTYSLISVITLKL